MAIRTYDDLPCVPMYLVSRAGRLVEGFTGFFLTRPTYKEPHLCWVVGPDARLESFHAYFERKWRAHERSEVALCVPRDRD